MKKLTGTILIVLIVSIVISVVNKQYNHDQNNEEKSIAVIESNQHDYKIDLIDNKGRNVGNISLNESSDSVTIRLIAHDLAPGKHAFHIHSNGICERPSFISAGDHVNFSNKEHGFDNPKGHHEGDLPNIEVGADGRIDIELNVPLVTLEKDRNNTLMDENGSSFIIHKDADDYVTDPSGNANERIVCGALKDYGSL